MTKYSEHVKDEKILLKPTTKKLNSEVVITHALLCTVHVVKNHVTSVTVLNLINYKLFT